MVAHDIVYKLSNFKIFVGIRLFHRKLAKWAFIFHENNFDKVHKANKSNMDVSV
jgi:hypothetical protein